ncbi:S-layer homology domain-containing protein [Cytobacillus sp. IB215665]|uniref:S-layer homology domain-containing protein n=1 Tax=Cytobacillus sp. IB215665 TaxID=3097357 RepID=UPI002A0F1D11|nr:S-layer homology domain-containing protein [Cytobacillus sp. IB215665]MDX8363775.1 S-layer homology domain-containing protein [Cytobacillus sp. IB215665]
MNNKKFLASAISAALVASVATPAAIHAKTNFTDLKAGETFYTEVQTFVEKGIITGYPDGTFKPYQSLSRGQAAKLFTRALDIDIPNNVDELIADYTDIQPGSEFADYVAAMKSANLLKEDGDNVFNAGAPLTRDVMAMWLVKAFNLKPNPDVNVTLTDLHTVGSEYVDAVKVLFQNGITTGKDDGRYAPAEAVKRGQFAAFMYRSMFRIESVEDVPDMTFDISEEVVLPDTVQVSYYDGRTEEAAVSWNDQDFDFTKPGVYELIGSVAGVDKKVYTTVVIEDGPLAIKDITAPNLRQIEIDLNHDRYNSDIVENMRYYDIVDDRDDNIEIAQIRADKDKIIITLEEVQQNNSDVYVTVDETITGEDYGESVEFLDTTVPEVVDVSAISKRNIKVSFSEAMDFDALHGEEITNRDIKSAFEIDDDKYSIKSMTVTDHGKAVNIELYSTIKEGDHTLTLVDQLFDYGKYQVKSSTFEFDVDYDNTDPTLERVTNIQPNQFTLVFNKDIQLDDEDRDFEESFYHTNRSHEAQTVYQKNEREIVVIFGQNDLMEGDTEIFVDSYAIFDLWGNPNGSIVESISLSDDETSPIIENVQMISEEDASTSYVQLLVTFSEPVNTDTALDEENFSIYDDDDNDLFIKRVEIEEDAYDDQTFIITLDTRYGELPKAEYTLKAYDIEDLFENELDENKYTFEAGSEVPPEDFTANVFVDDDALYFVIDFNEKMATTGQYSIEDLDKYELAYKNDSVLLEDLDDEQNVRISTNPYDGGKMLEIVIKRTGILSEAYEDFLDDIFDDIEDSDVDDITLSVAMVANNNGVRTARLTNDIELDSEESFAIGSEEIVALETDTIQVTFDEPLYDFDIDDFEVYVDEDGDRNADAREILEIDDYDIEMEDDETVLTIILDDDDELDHDAKINDDKIYITTIDDPYTSNRFGQTIEINDELVEDRISPEIAFDDDEAEVYVHKHKDHDDKAIISITFTENMDEDTLSRLSFEVGGGTYDVESASVVDEVVYLVVDLDGDDPEDLVGEYVEQLNSVTDKNNNTVNNIEVKIEDEKGSKDTDDIS